MVKILAISDEELIEGHEATLGNDIDEDIDVLVSCGDLSPSYLEYAINRFFPNPSLMVLGNHDKIFFHDSKASEGFSDVYKGLYVLIEDYVTIDDTFNSKIKAPINFGGFSGAMAYGDRPFFFNEKEASKFVNKLKRQNFFNDFNIDIMLSHAAPQVNGLVDSVDSFHAPSESLGELLEYFSPKLWLYGHVHPRYTNSNLDFNVDGMHLVNCVPYRIIDYDEEQKFVRDISKKI